MNKNNKVIAKQLIIFRADGNSRIGLGHVVRSLALAQMLREEFECVFAIQMPTPDLQAQIKEVCHGLISIPACTPEEERYPHELEAFVSDEEIVVLDGYNFDTAYQQNIKSKGAMVVCIDDVSAYPFAADVVLNPAGGLARQDYSIAPYTKLLLGPQYALLRQPFLEAAAQQRHFPSGGLRVLLNLGGADPENHTLRLAEELFVSAQFESLEVVVGGAYRHLPALQQWLQEKTGIRLHRNLTAFEMCSLMQLCPVALTSASGVAYEYASVGGLLYVLKTAANQKRLYNFIIQTGVASEYKKDVNLEIHRITSKFQQQVEAQRQYFDGKSAERLQEVFKNLSLATGLRLRNATEKDLLLVYHWNNDPEVRKRSFNPKPISLEEHTRWFNARLADEASSIYIAEVAGKASAQVRFAISGATASLSYLIAKEFRGKGLGHTVLLKGVAQLRQDHPEINLVAGLVQRENTASVRAFEKAGFAYGVPDPEHSEAHRFELAL